MLSLIALLCFFSSRISAQVGQDSLYLDSIIIIGNKITHRDIILRELPFKENHFFKLNKITEAYAIGTSQLNNTALFTSVAITDSIAGDSIYMIVRLQERWYIFPELSFAIAGQNFNTWLRDAQLYRTTLGLSISDANFRGRAEKLAIDFVVGWRTLIGLRYRVPYLNRAKTIGVSYGINYQLGHELPFATDSNQQKFFRLRDRYIYKKANGNIEFSYRPKLRTSYTVGAGMDYIEINDTVARQLNPDYLGQGRDILRLPYINAQINYQALDYFNYPTTGVYAFARIEQKGFSFQTSDQHITNIQVGAEHYFRILPKLILANNIRATQVLYGLPSYILTNSIGYGSNVRGYELYVVNGRGTYVSNNELRYRLYKNTFRLHKKILPQFTQIPLSIYAKLFGDAGYTDHAPKEIKIFNNSLNDRILFGYGFGLDFVTYYDKVFRFEYALNGLQQSGFFIHYTAAF